MTYCGDTLVFYQYIVIDIGNKHVKQQHQTKSEVKHDYSITIHTVQFLSTIQFSQ